MCDDGGGMRFNVKTRTLSGDTVGLQLTGREANETGELFAIVQGSQLEARYDGTPSPLTGTLRRGGPQDFEDACLFLKNGSAPAHERDPHGVSREHSDRNPGT